MNEPDIPNRELSEQIGDLRKDVNRRFETVEKKVDRIEIALYGTGNPHGGLFERFTALEGKVSTLSTEIKGVKETLIAKIDGVEKNFNKMFSFAKWAVGVAAVPICAVAIPIFIEVVLPILRKWIGV